MNGKAEKELNTFRNEIYRGELEVESNKRAFANQLMNGLGDEMIKELNNPTKPSKWLIFKVKVKRFFNTLIEVL